MVAYAGPFALVIAFVVLLTITVRPPFGFTSSWCKRFGPCFFRAFGCDSGCVQGLGGFFAGFVRLFLVSPGTMGTEVGKLREPET